MTDGDGVCSHVECTDDRPDNLVKRRLIGTNWIETYCEKHDPMDDPRVGDHWVAV